MEGVSKEGVMCLREREEEGEGLRGGEGVKESFNGEEGIHVRPDGGRKRWWCRLFCMVSGGSK